MDRTTVAVIGVLFLASFIRSAFGFGEALVAVPLLALFMPVTMAAPLAVLVSITIAAMIVVQDWKEIHLRSAGWLFLSTLPGIPLGLWLLHAAPEPIVKSVLAAVIIAFSAFSLARPNLIELKSERLSWIFGGAAGVLGGAYGMNGPPLVIFGTLRRWSPQHLRATLQGYFLPASLIGMAGYWLMGLWTPPVTRSYLAALPAILAATLLGRLANRRISGDAFILYVHVGLIGTGIALLAGALRK